MSHLNWRACAHAAARVLSLFIAREVPPGILYFPVVQICEQGSHHWVEKPAADKPDARLADPAPAVMVTPGK